MSEPSDEANDIDFLKEEIEAVKSGLLTVWAFTESDERMTAEIFQQVDDLVNRATTILEEIEKKLGIESEE